MNHTLDTARPHAIGRSGDLDHPHTTGSLHGRR